MLKRSTLAERRQTAEEFVAEGDWVVARLTYTGTRDGELFGIAPTVRRVSYAGVVRFRIVSDQIATVGC